MEITLEEICSNNVTNTHRAVVFYSPKRIEQIQREYPQFKPHPIQILETEILSYLSEGVEETPAYSTMTLDARGANMALAMMGKPLFNEPRTTRKEAFDYFLKDTQKENPSRNIAQSPEMQEKYQRLQTLYIQLEKDIEEESKKPPKPLRPIVKDYLAWRTMRESRN